MTTSREIYDAYEERSWRTLAQRARKRGEPFVVGKREGPYVWDLDGKRRLLDCAVGGGVHSLGHANPEVAGALRSAIDSGMDGGLWTFPSPAMLSFQDALAKVSPSPALNRSVITLSSTAAIDLAIQMAARVTGRTQVAAYRHGYHGHAGFAAMVTGSVEEGIQELYGLPNPVGQFFSEYGDLDEISSVIGETTAAIILEPFDYESWQPASSDYLLCIQALCRERGALLIVDETRTGLGRSGRMWMSELTGVSPDMLITGKGLSGGLYPVGALMTTTAIYDACINAHPFAYATSLGGNEISCLIGERVLEVCSRPEFITGVEALGDRFRTRFQELCERYPRHFSQPNVVGGVVTLGLRNPEAAPEVSRYLFDHGVLCHSISLVDPICIKFLPVLTAAPGIADEVTDALEGYVRSSHRE
jgi:acetylornithine/succinyldiaminopimelate/putrescine aminotransferase